MPRCTQMCIEQMVSGILENILVHFLNFSGYLFLFGIKTRNKLILNPLCNLCTNFFQIFRKGLEML